MKKQIVVLLLVLLPVLSFADAKDWWFGGAARMMAVGEMTVALPDYSNVYDLYGAGFPTALLWRDEKSVEGFAPFGNAADSQMVDCWGGNNSLKAWMGKNSILALNFGYGKQDGRLSKSEMTMIGTIKWDFAINQYGLGGNIGFIHKLAKDTGISISVFSADMRMINETTVSNLLMLTTTNDNSNKSEKSAGVNLCIDKHIGDLALPFVSDLLPRLDLALSIGYKVNDDYRTGYYYDSLPITFTSLERQNDKLINVNLGLVFTAPKQKSNVVLNIAKSFVVDYKYYYNSTSSTSTGVVIDETRVDLNAKLNYYITDYLLGTVKLRWKDPDYGYALGLALVNDFIRLPLEYYKNDIDWKTESLGAGIEYNFVKPLCVRLGARLHGYYETRVNYTAGLGLETNAFLCDIGMAYETEKGIWTNTRVLADVKAVW